MQDLHSLPYVISPLLFAISNFSHMLQKNQFISLYGTGSINLFPFVYLMFFETAVVHQDGAFLSLTPLPLFWIAERDAENFYARMKFFSRQKIK